MRRALVALCLCSGLAVAQTSMWRYVPGDATQITYLEWRKVLNSRWSDLIRREIPPAAAPLLGSINFIEGIDRVVLATTSKSGVVVLQGRFDTERLKSMATSDGGTVKPYGGAELLLAGEQPETTEVAIISNTMLLIAPRDELMRALDRRPPANPTVATGYDLWIRTRAPSPDIEAYDFGLAMEERGVRLDGEMRMVSDARAEVLAANAQAYDMVSTVTGRVVKLLGRYGRDEFARRAGQWRTSLEKLEPVEPAAQPVSGKIRIFGLDEGVREIDLPPVKR